MNEFERVLREAVIAELDSSRNEARNEAELFDFAFHRLIFWAVQLMANRVCVERLSAERIFDITDFAAERIVNSLQIDLSDEFERELH